MVNRNLYDATKREPTEYGCLDRRLGVSDKKTKCTSCGKELTDCIGHFGHVSLELPVYHIGYFKEVIFIIIIIIYSNNCNIVIVANGVI